MFAQNHQGPNARLNGVPAGSRMPSMLYNYQQQPPQHQTHAQHHPTLQSDHTHASNGSALAHHANFANAGIPNASSPFNVSALQNGHGTTRGGQAQSINEHWAEQLKLHKDAERAHGAMIEHGQPHYFARTKAAENRGIVAASPPSKAALAADGESEDTRRPWTVDAPVARQDWNKMDLSGQGFRNVSPQLCKYDFLTALYIASNKLTRLPPAIGQLRKLQHLDASFNQISELPPELGMCTYLKQLLLFDNRLVSLPFELGSLHLLEVLGIEGNPLEHQQKQEVVERGSKSLITWLRENAPIPVAPVDRAEIAVQEHVSPSLEKIKLLSWNILCDRYATSATYGYTPQNALDWEYRKDCVLQEIRDRDADIVCLQEVTKEKFDQFFSPEMAKQGYGGVQRSKTRADWLPGPEAAFIDGCAIFYKKSKYFPIDAHVVKLKELAIKSDGMKKHPDVFNRVMPKDNIAVICFFESLETGARFIVINAHLTWEASLADVKLIQTGVLMDYARVQADRYTRKPALKDLKEFKDYVKANNKARAGEDGAASSSPPAIEAGPSQEYRNNTDIPIFVCGDFNSKEDSSVYELMSMGRVPPEHPDLSKYKYGDFSRDGIEHPFSLRDAYAHLKNTPDELPFTNYTPGFTGIIDYIWYSANNLEVVSLLGPPDPDYLKRVPAFPHWHFPADHIHIMSEFVIKARKDKKVHVEPDFGGGSGSGDKKH